MQALLSAAISSDDAKAAVRCRLADVRLSAISRRTAAWQPADRTEVTLPVVENGDRSRLGLFQPLQRWLADI